MSEKILVINKRHIGDVILSTAALKLLRKARPQAHISVLVPAACAPLIRGTGTQYPGVVDTVLCDTPSSNKWLRSLAKTKEALVHRFSRYDTCLFLGESATNARRFRWLSNFKHTLCAKLDMNGRPNGPAPFCNQSIAAGTVWDTHVADYFQNVVRGLYAVEGSELTYVVPPTAADPSAERLRAEPGKKIALCFECSPTNLTLWPDNSWVELIRNLHEQGHSLFSAFPPQQKEAAQRLIAQSGVPVAALPSNLSQCLSLLKCADLLIAVDTGQVHLAAALGVPVLALAGATASGTYPYTTRGVALATARNCYECPFIAECPSNHKTGRNHEPGYVSPCMRRLPVKAVQAWANRMLEQPEQPERLVLVEG